MPKSLLDHAFDYVSKSKEPVAFKDIWQYVVEQAGLDAETAEQKVSRFYTNLMLDGRFVTLGENNWDLRERQTFDKVHIDMKDVYSEVDEEEDSTDSEEKDEEKEYRKAFEETSDDEDDEEEQEEGEEEEEN